MKLHLFQYPTGLTQFSEKFGNRDTGYHNTGQFWSAGSQDIDVCRANFHI